MWWTEIIFVAFNAILVETSAQCGLPRHGPTGLIVRGENAKKGKWPWHVAVFHKQQSSTTYVCGGTIISRTHVLTAAHCVLHHSANYPLSSSNVIIEAGAHDLNLNLQGRQRHTVKQIFKMEKYRKGSNRYDIAILELDSEVEFNQFVQPACVYQESDLTGKTGTAIGWGVTETDEPSRILKEVQLPVVDFHTCLASNRDVFRTSLSDGMFCAGFTNGTGVCNGDSGGGLFINVNRAWYIGGIVSFAGTRESNTNLCHTNGYAVFTKVFDYLSWIKHIADIDHLNNSGESEAHSTEGQLCKPRDDNASKIGVAAFPRNCGIYSPERIAHGEEARVFEFPCMAMLIDRDSYFVCAGTLINKRYVLATVNCVQREDPPNQVKLGEHTRRQPQDCNEEHDCAPPVRNYYIECIVQHQKYDSRAKLHNIALVRLQEDVIFEDHIHPICLPIPSELRSEHLPAYIVTGWGHTDNDGQKSLVLRKANIKAGDRAKCQQLTSKEQYVVDLSTDQLLCTLASNSSADICGGDFGGPLGATVRINGGLRFVQFGIASAAWGRCRGGLSVYTGVGAHMDWMMANMRE